MNGLVRLLSSPRLSSNCSNWPGENRASTHNAGLPFRHTVLRNAIIPLVPHAGQDRGMQLSGKKPGLRDSCR